MKLNNKGFSLVELLAVMIILSIILTVAIPSITSSLSRSENKQLEAQKENIKAIALIKLKRSSFARDEDYNKFNRETSACKVFISDLIRLGYVPEKVGKDKKGDLIKVCVGYENKEFKVFDSCTTKCEMKS